jgi:hypothetical protein
MTPSVPVPHDRAARDERAAGRDQQATARDERAAARDHAAAVRDTAATTRDGELLDRARQLRERFTVADARHAAEDTRRENLARQRAQTDDYASAEQAQINEETRRSERDLDAADASAVRAELDWLSDIYLRDTRRDRVDAADDRDRSRTDRTDAGQDRTAAQAERQQSAIDDAQQH